MFVFTTHDSPKSPSHPTSTRRRRPSSRATRDATPPTRQTRARHGASVVEREAVVSSRARGRGAARGDAREEKGVDACVGAGARG